MECTWVTSGDTHIDSPRTGTDMKLPCKAIQHLIKSNCAGSIRIKPRSREEGWICGGDGSRQTFEGWERANEHDFGAWPRHPDHGMDTERRHERSRMTDSPVSGRRILVRLVAARVGAQDRAGRNGRGPVSRVSSATPHVLTARNTI